MAEDSPANGNALPIEGKTVASARQGKTKAGYDYVSFLFSDGTVLRIEEQGQVGWFSVEILTKHTAG